MSIIWQITNNARKLLTRDIKTLLDEAGAVDWLGSRNAPVFLKPNLVVSRPASGGATTHPEIAEGLIEYLLDHGYSNIAVAEGSWVGDSTARAFEICGYTGLADKYKIGLIDLQKDSGVDINIHGQTYKLCETIYELIHNGGSLINLPVLKGHGQTRLTCALKNLKGCIPDSEKRRYHSLGVHKPVALLNTVIRPAFTLVDGLNGDPYWEEGGSPEKRDLLLLGRDSVSIDSYACRIMGFSAAEVDYIGIAESLGVGESTVGDSDIVHPGSAAASRPRSADDADAVSVRNWINGITDQRAACSACFGYLAGALRELKTENPAAADSLIEKSICIGQDFQGVILPQEKTGIGTCTSGENCLRGCPPSQAAIKNFLAG